MCKKRRNKGLPALDVLAVLSFPSGDAGGVEAQAFQS